MLGKLIKYEYKATARLFLPLYLVVILFAIITKIINPFNSLNASNNISLQAILSTISIVVYFALVVGIIVMTLIIMIQRFYKSLLGDEGYLMFTLPVKVWEHIVSKLLISMLWTALSFFTVMVSVMILTDAQEILRELPYIIDQLRTHIGNTGLFLIPVYAVIACAYYIITIYNAIALGHLFTKHKILASFGAYIVLYIISQTVTSIAVLLFGYAIINPLGAAVAPTPSHISTFIIALMCVFAALGTANFICANFVLRKKLNLE